MNLSTHVTLQEFEFSQAATRFGLNNAMTAPELRAATLLCTTVLDSIRDFYGRELLISSGYRSPAVNKKVGGAINSQHTKGEAADFTIKGLTVGQVFNDIRHRQISHLTWDQLIYEGAWVHISYVGGHNRFDVLKAIFTPDGVVYNKVND